MTAKKNHERALICNRVQSGVKRSVRRIAELAGVTVTEVADCLLKIQDFTVEGLCYGKAAFTGNTRTFGKAVASEIRCRKCGLTYWETGLPYALCVDCRSVVVRPFVVEALKKK